MGGMQTLQWAIDFPRAGVGRYIALAVGARPHAQSHAFNARDDRRSFPIPKWRNATYEPERVPPGALAVARMMAHITYLFGCGNGEQVRPTAAARATRRQHFDVEFEVAELPALQRAELRHPSTRTPTSTSPRRFDRFDLYGPDNRLDDALSAVRSRGLVSALPPGLPLSAAGKLGRVVEALPCDLAEGTPVTRSFRWTFRFTILFSFARRSPLLPDSDFPRPSERCRRKRQVDLQVIAQMVCARRTA